MTTMSSVLSRLMKATRPAGDESPAGLSVHRRRRRQKPFVLRAKGAAAAASARRIRVLEREARTLHRRDVIDGDAVDVLSGEGIDKHLPVALFDDHVVFSRRVFDQ